MSTGPIKMDYLVSIFGEDREFFGELFQTYCDDNTLRMNELRDKMGEKDASSIEHLAHSIKGASGNIGADAMKDFAAELETMGRESELSGASSVIESMASEFEEIKTYIDSYINS